MLVIENGKFSGEQNYSFDEPVMIRIERVQKNRTFTSQETDIFEKLFLNSVKNFLVADLRNLP